MTPADSWRSGDAYERFMGRWSRIVAARFIDDLGVGPGRDWLDVGCGSGAVADAVATRARPARVVGVDPSPAFVAHAAAHRYGIRAAVGRAEALPFASASVDVAVAGLVLNFIADPGAAVTEMARCARLAVGVYVWDYGGEMRLLRAFWRAAADLDHRAAALDEGARFEPLCRPAVLRSLFLDAGLGGVAVTPLDITMRFADLEDCWTPFLGGQGPAPTYCASLTPEHRRALRARFAEELAATPGAAIELPARAWATVGRPAQVP